MKRIPIFASFFLFAGFAFGSVADLHGVVANTRGLPLSGVVVRLASGTDSAVSAADGSWRLARTSSRSSRPHLNHAASPSWSIGGEGFLPSFGGFWPDGRRSSSQATLAPSGARTSWRSHQTASDTLLLRWKGAVVKTPVVAGLQGNLGRTELDTTGLNQLEIRSSRFSLLQNLSGIHLEIVNLDSIPHDSLSLRFHLEGTAREMADFGANLDLAVHYTVTGFYTPAELDPSPISRAHPRLADPHCPSENSCAWTFDLPLFPMSFPVMSRFSISLVFRRHVLSGDSSGFVVLPPTHDPFAGKDWSFRAHGSGTSLVYAGVPVLDPSGPPVAPVHPFVQLMRGTRVLYGRAPEAAP